MRCYKKRFNYKFCYWFVVLSTLVLCSCSKPTGERILGDETFFDKEVVPVYVKGKADTLKQLHERFNEKTLYKGTDADFSSTFSISVPDKLQPVIGEIIEKYGQPDKIEKNIFYYGDLGFRTEKGEPEKKVIAIDVVCTIHAKGGQ